MDEVAEAVMAEIFTRLPAIEGDLLQFSASH
jgi:hypothetical protein